MVCITDGDVRAVSFKSLIGLTVADARHLAAGGLKVRQDQQFCPL